MRYIFIFLAMLIAARAAAQSQNNNSETTSQSSSDRQAMVQLSRDLIKAFWQGDASTLERILAEDYKRTIFHGRVLDKQEVLENAGIDLITALSEMDISAKVYGDAAIVYSTYELKYKVRNEDQTDYIRFTDIFIKQQDSWHAITSHESQVPTWKVREMEDKELEPITLRPCKEEANLNSINSNVMTLLRFKNETNQQVKIYWIDFAGKRTQERPMEPGKTIDITTFLTHPFVVVGENGECMGIYLPTQEPALAVIKEN